MNREKDKKKSYLNKSTTEKYNIIKMKFAQSDDINENQDLPPALIDWSIIV